MKQSFWNVLPLCSKWLSVNSALLSFFILQFFFDACHVWLFGSQVCVEPQAFSGQSASAWDCLQWFRTSGLHKQLYTYRLAAERGVLQWYVWFILVCQGKHCKMYLQVVTVLKTLAPPLMDLIWLKVNSYNECCLVRMTIKSSNNNLYLDR